MDLITLLEQVSFPAAAASLVGTTLVGMIYYAPRVLGEKWRVEAGLTKKQMNTTEGMGLQFAKMFLFYFVSALLLSALFKELRITEIWDGATIGAAIGFAIVGLPHAVHALFEKKSDAYRALIVFHDILTFAVVGATISWLI